jgi:three-Cys-motif partner protein
MCPQNADHFCRFEPHTKLKHACLSNYLATWVAKLSLSSKGRRHDTLALIDAFAGKGCDDEGRPGSPMIMIEVARRMLAKLTAGGVRPRVEITLIEKKRARARQLQQNVQQYPPEEGWGVRAISGTLHDAADELLLRYIDLPMLVFLDPFGVVGLNAELVRRTLAGRQHEVLIQFNSAAAERLVHVASKSETKAEARVRGEQHQGSLFAVEVHPRVVTALRSSREGLERTQKRVRHHLQVIYGAPDWPTLEERLVATLGPDATAVDAFADLLIRSGATYVSRLPVFNAAGGLQYVLLHATKNAVGRQAIKESFCAALRASELPPRVVQATFLRLWVKDADVTAALRKFEGRRVPWAKGKSGSLQEYLLRETAVFPSQLSEIKAALRAAGWKVPGAAEEFQIPKPLRPLGLVPRTA